MTKIWNKFKRTRTGGKDNTHYKIHFLLSSRHQCYFRLTSILICEIQQETVYTVYRFTLSHLDSFRLLPKEPG